MLMKALAWAARELVAKTGLLLLAVTLLVGGFLYYTPEQVDLTLPVRAELKQDQTAPGRDGFLSFYSRWLGRVASGQWGRNLLGQKVIDELGPRLLVTALLSFGAAACQVAVSFIFAVLMVSRPRHPITRFGLSGIYLITALPTFLLAYLSFSFFPLSFEGWARYLIPLLILAAGDGFISELSRLSAGGLARELRQPYIETAVVKGLRRNAAWPFKGSVLRHAARQALIQLMPRLGLRIPQIAGLSIIVEKIFALEGLGDMLLDGLGTRDLNRVLVVTLCFVILVRVMSFSAQAFSTALDPRARG